MGDFLLIVKLLRGVVLGVILLIFVFKFFSFLSVCLWYIVDIFVVFIKLMVIFL